MFKIYNSGKITGCFCIRIETKKCSYFIEKAKDCGIRRNIGKKHFNPFLKKNIMFIYI